MLLYTDSLGLSTSRLVIACVLSFPPHVCNEEDHCKQETKATDDDVANGEEEVLSTEDVQGREDEALAALECTHIEIIDDPQEVLARVERLLDSAIQFPEVWQTGSPHPHDEAIYAHKTQD